MSCRFHLTLVSPTAGATYTCSFANARDTAAARRSSAVSSRLRRTRLHLPPVPMLAAHTSSVASSAKPEPLPSDL